MRLDTQHQFMRALSNGHLIHPSIPLHGVQAIADVGTGTGMWLRDTASQMLSSERATQSIEFWGFDISAQQFPPEESPGTKFQVHNIVDSFPPQFHEKFDVVHVRLLSYAIKAKDLEKVVDNIVQILRPGGYLQWQECDIIDVWARPETAQTRSTVAYIVSERIARGLTPAISTPLVRTIQAMAKAPPPRKLNPINWSDEVMRITHLETLSTAGHGSTLVQKEKATIIMTVAVQLIQAGIAGRKARIAGSDTSSSEVDFLMKDVESMTALIDLIKQGKMRDESTWDMAATWVIARKALFFAEGEAWMTARSTPGE